MGASLGTTIAIRRLVPEPPGVGRVVWWIGLVLSAVWVAIIVERVARRALPLVTLLKLGMLFPDRAPSRFAIAREAGSIRRLEERLAGLDADPSAADEASSARIILALTVALQNHDRKTRGHAERVRVFTDLLAEELRLPDEDRYRLRWAALLHDIGKLSVKARILNKPGTLDAREWDEIRKHPAEGARIAGSLLEWLGPWGLAISQHHERIDGTGYPGRIPGHEIALAARVVSVADAYDTMTAARTYRKPIAVRAARQELADCAGTQFDREIVRAFFAISLPKLLWKTGPVSLLFHLPHLHELEAIGRQSLAAAGHSVTAATVAASVTVMTVGAPLSASASEPVRGEPAVSIELASLRRASETEPQQLAADEDQASVGVVTSGSAVELASSAESVAGVEGTRGGSDVEPPVVGDGGDDHEDGDDDQGVEDNAGGGGSHGQSGEAPGNGRSGDDNGRSGDDHGQSGDDHGQSGDDHGQSGDDHGQSGDDHGNDGDPPGQDEEPPGQDGDPPGNDGDPPGQEDEPPGQSGDEHGQDGRP
jgi:putative nucleotidyltransferase with HDIG domain